MASSWGELLIGQKQGTQVIGGTATGSAFDCPGGICVFSVVASAFNAATVALYVLGPDGVTWIAAGAATTLVANGMGIVYLPPCQIQAQVSGATPAGVFAAISRVVE
jgi:hypothetical protein